MHKTLLFLLLIITSFVQAQVGYEWGYLFDTDVNTGFTQTIVYDVVTDSNDAIYLAGTFTGTVDFDPGAGVQNATGNGDIFILKLDANKNFVWLRTYAGGSGDVDIAYALAINSQDQIHATGYFRGAIDFNPGGAGGQVQFENDNNADVFVLILNADGSFHNATSWYGPGFEMGRDISVDAFDSVYLSMYFQLTSTGPNNTILTNTGPNNAIGVDAGDIANAKYTGNNLQLAWAYAMGTGSSSPNNAVNNPEVGEAITSNGTRVATVGRFLGTPMDIDPSANTNNIGSNTATSGFIQVLDQNGAFVWGKSLYSASSFDNITDAVFYNNDLYVIGNYRGVGIELDGNTANGNELTNTSNGQDKIFIAKYNNTGGLIWAKGVNGTLGSYARKIVIDGTNGIIITGDYRGNNDFDPGVTGGEITSDASSAPDTFIAAYDHNGNFQWVVQTIGDPGNEIGRGIALDSNSNIIAVGSSTSLVPDLDPTTGVDQYFGEPTETAGFIQKLTNVLLSTDERALQPVSVYPTLVKERIKIETLARITTAELFDISGKKIMTSDDNELNVANLASGMYILKINLETGQTHTQKIHKQ